MLIPGLIVVGIVTSWVDDYINKDEVSDTKKKISNENEDEKEIQYSKTLASGEIKKRKEEEKTVMWEQLYKEKKEEISQLKHELRMWKHQNMFQFNSPYVRGEKRSKQQESNNEQNLPTYLRNVCYRNKLVTFHTDENDFYVEIKENDAYIYLLLQRKGELQVKGIVAKDVMRLIDIDFRQYGEKERYLVRNFFGKIVKEYVSNELEMKKEIDDDMQKEKQRREQEAMEMKEQENILLNLVIRKYEEIQEMIQKIEENDANIPVETKYKIEKHYTSDIESMIRAFRSLSLEDKKREHKQFLSALDDVKQSLKRDIECIEKEKVFVFKKQLRVLQQRSGD